MNETLKEILRLAKSQEGLIKKPEDSDVKISRTLNIHMEFKSLNKELHNLIPSKVKDINNLKEMTIEYQKLLIDKNNLMNHMLLDIDKLKDLNTKLVKYDFDLEKQRENFLCRFKDNVIFYGEKTGKIINIPDNIKNVDQMVGIIIETCDIDLKLNFKNIQSKIVRIIDENQIKAKNEVRLKEINELEDKKINDSVQLLKELAQEKDEKEKNYDKLKVKFNHKFNEVKIKNQKFREEQDEYSKRQKFQIVFLIIVFAILISFFYLNK